MYIKVNRAVIKSTIMTHNITNHQIDLFFPSSLITEILGGGGTIGLIAFAAFGVGNENFAGLGTPFGIGDENFAELTTPFGTGDEYFAKLQEQVANN